MQIRENSPQAQKTFLLFLQNRCRSTRSFQNTQQQYNNFFYNLNNKKSFIAFFSQKISPALCLCSDNNHRVRMTLVFNNEHFFGFVIALNLSSNTMSKVLYFSHFKIQKLRFSVIKLLFKKHTVIDSTGDGIPASLLLITGLSWLLSYRAPQRRKGFYSNLYS